MSSHRHQKYPDVHLKPYSGEEGIELGNLGKKDSRRSRTPGPEEEFENLSPGPGTGRAASPLPSWFNKSSHRRDERLRQLREQQSREASYRTSVATSNDDLGSFYLEDSISRKSAAGGGAQEASSSFRPLLRHPLNPPPRVLKRHPLNPPPRVKKTSPVHRPVPPDDRPRHVLPNRPANTWDRMVMEPQQAERFQRRRRPSESCWGDCFGSGKDC